MNIIPVTVDSVKSLTSAKRAWMLIVWELILRGRSTLIIIVQVETGSSMLSAGFCLFSCVT